MGISWLPASVLEAVVSLVLRNGKTTSCAIFGRAEAVKTSLGGRLPEGEPRPPPSAPTPSVVRASVRDRDFAAVMWWRCCIQGLRRSRAIALGSADVLCAVRLATSFMCPRGVRLNGITADGRMKVLRVGDESFSFFSDRMEEPVVTSYHRWLWYRGL